MANTLVGIDIAYDSLKAIGLNKIGSRYWLVGMNSAPIPPGSWTTSELNNREEIAKVLRETFAAAKPKAITPKRVMIALPESVIFSGTFSVPTLTPKELKQALPFEIAERLSINLDEYHIDYEITSSSCKPLAEVEHKISNPESEARPPVKKDPKSKTDADQPTADSAVEEPHTAIFAIAAKKTLIDSIIELGQLAKVEIGGIDIKPGAVARAVASAKDKTMRLIIDLGASTTVVLVAEGQSPHLTSSVPIGVKAMNEQPETALERFKAEAGPIFDELVHVTKFYENRICPGGTIKEVILSGGGSNIAGISELFAEQTGLPTKLANPLALVETHHYPISDSLARTFSDAIGLAMRNV